MNKRHTGKLLAFLLAVVFMFTLVPQVFADDGADIGRWTYIHDTAGNWNQSLGGLPKDDFQGDSEIKSVLKIDTEEVPGNGENFSFEDIHEGAELYLQIAFHFDNSPPGQGVHESFYEDAKAGDFFEFALPEWVTFSIDTVSGEIIDPSTNIKFAEWEIEANKLKVTLWGESGEGISDVALASDLWGRIEIKGKFDEVDEGSGPHEDIINFGGQTVTIKREESSGGDDDEALSKLKKSHEYLPEGNQIEWTIQLELPEGISFKDYAGFTLDDQLAGNHTYIEDSFEIGKSTSSLEEITSGLSFGSSNESFTYTFPVGSELEANESFFIRYKTQIGGIQPGPDKTNKFENSAILKHGTEDKSNGAKDDFSMAGFFSKTAGELIPEGDVFYIRWTVELTIDQTTGYTFVFPQARLVDQLTSAISGVHEYTENKPIEIEFPNGSPVDLTDTNVPFGNGNFEFLKYDPNGTGTEVASASEAEYLVYHFPDQHPISSESGVQKYILTYHTVILDWDSYFDSNQEVNITNRAWFEWGNEWAEGGTPGPGGTGGSLGIPGYEVNKKVKDDGGLIKKSLSPADQADDLKEEDYSYREPYFIQWEIVVNDNGIRMDWDDVSITDEVLTGNGLGTHIFYIDGDDHKLEIFKNNGTSAVASFSRLDTFITGTDTQKYTLSPVDSGFKVTFSGFAKSADTYKIVFYTKVDEADAFNKDNNGKTGKDVEYKNQATLNYGDYQKAGPVTAVKTLNYQMLKKTGYKTSFDPADRKMKYELVVNRNRLPLQNAVITDTLPMHMTLWTSEANPTNPEDYKGAFEVYANGAASSSTLDGTNIELTEYKEIELGPANDDDPAKKTYQFTLKLPESGSSTDGTPGDTYKIVFWVYLEDGALTKSDPEFTNQVELVLAGTDGAFTSSDTTKIDYKAFTKGHKAYSGGDEITWVIEINPAGANLGTGVFIEDTLSEYLELVKESDIHPIKFYPATYDAGTKKLVKTGEEGIDPAANSEFEDNYLKLFLPSGDIPYILEFTTSILAENKTITNKIDLKGGSVEPGESGSKSFKSENVFSNGGFGSYQLTVKKVDEKKQPIQGVEFNLLVPNGSYFKYKGENTSASGITDDLGEIVFNNLPNWSFKALEVDPPYGYYRAEASTAKNPSKDRQNPAIIEVENIEALAGFSVNKMTWAATEAGREPLSGAVFRLYQDGEPTDYTAISDADGEAKFTGVKLGDYTLYEETAPPGYRRITAGLNVKVDYAGTNKTEAEGVSVQIQPIAGTGDENLVGNEDVGFTFLNRLAGKITIEKRGASGPLANVTFELLDAEKEPYGNPSTRTTGTDGKVTFAELPLGTYYVKETAAPSGYHLNTTLHEVVLTDGAGPELGDNDEPVVGWKKTLELHNYLLTDSVILTKTDPNGVALDGGWFGIFSNAEATGEPLDKVQADGGQIVFSGLLPGAYYVRELEAPAGYIKSDKIIKVGVSVSGNSIAGEVVKEPLVNTWAGGIKLVKVDEKGEPLAGAVFELLDANKKVIKEGTSGKDGVIEFKELAMGTYYLREKTAPAGYAKLMELTEVVLKAGAEADMVKTVKLANHRNLASVTLRKTNQYDGLVSGGLFGIYKTDDTGFKNPLQKVASVKGMITFTDLEAGQYFIREIEAPKHHKRTDEFVKVVLEVNPDTGLLEDLEIEEPLLNETPLTEEEWDEIVEGDEEEKDNGEKDDDLVETGGFLDTAMLWFFGTLLILAGAILLLRMRAALVRK